MKQAFHDSVWRMRDFRRLAVGRSVAAAGAGMVLIVQLLRLSAQGAGSDRIMMLLFAEVVPVILGAGLIGRAADHRDSRGVLTLGIAAEVAACLVLATAPDFAVTCAAIALLSAGTSLVAPVWSVLVPMVVGEDRVGAAVGGQQSLTAALAPLGAGAGGVLYSSVGGGGAMLCAAGCYLYLAVVALRLKVRRRAVVAAAGADRSGLRQLLAPDLGALQGDRLIWCLLSCMVPLVVVLQGLNVLEVSLARHDIGVSAAQFGCSEIAAGVGTVVGAALAGRIEGARTRGWAMLLGLTAAAAALGILGVATTVPAYFGLLVVVGAGVGVSNTSFGALFITRTPSERRGRVSAAVNGLMQAASTAAIALGGLLGVLLGIRPAFVVSGLAGLVVLATGAVVLARTSTETLPDQPVDVPLTVPAP
ncbi:MFS transporter [Allobranchiibius sp. CTAmp26]|uniref:MFS transporter n=1 Tax=Allobranchiibius sp. CTAmp26 TaxID=2815214 RepID=UPI001AA0E67F|nr:MFS transporter [Allobranchiibius sp. CTAmp26]MBO1753878.1 MFS transporter [Allobranchiibius sp. CTAmp26]